MVAMRAWLLVYDAPDTVAHVWRVAHGAPATVPKTYSKRSMNHSQTAHANCKKP